jgi:hypothetical protein
MKTDYDSSRLKALLAVLLDGELSAAEKVEINAILRSSAAARAHYHRSVRLHAALMRHQPEVNVVAFPPRRFMRAVAVTAIAACLALGGFLWLQSPTAALTGSTAAIWRSETTAQDLCKSPQELISGYAELTYRSGVRVILQGPCQFEITSAESIHVTHGRATVKVPHHLNGFHLDTPAGRITDLGTEFGVAVGSSETGPVILTEVFDGEIEIPAETTPRKRMVSGDSLAILRETGGTRLVSTMGGYPVSLEDSARRLPRASSHPHVTGNLALGKPVTSPAFYAKAQGSVFPPSNLTDGRFNDSGTPGDWSFWLAPNGQAGEFTVDLLSVQPIGRVTLHNTRNRSNGDRGLHDFIILTSEDGVHYEEILEGRLDRIPQLPAPGIDFPSQTFHFPTTLARYIKLVGLSYHSHPDRPATDINQGGGLNEIQVFAP